MDLINILLHNPIQVVLSVVALVLSTYAALTARDNKRDMKHHVEIDEGMHTQMLTKVDAVKEDLESFTGTWKTENERVRNHLGEVREAISDMRSDVSYLKGRAEQADA